jgi:superfamily II DNA/RNA helicase
MEGSDDAISFKDFKFTDKLNDSLDAMGFEKPTPIQAKAIPEINKGKDLIACAQTGTGKTAAFILPILNRICQQDSHNKVNTIVLAPTRELAIQIDQQIEGFSYFTDATSIPVYGGGSGDDFSSQKKALINGADVIICTPGRLISHLNFDYFDTSGVKHLILDEADRMLDMGFLDDILKIAKQLPKKRQTLLFSATMPSKIRDLAKKILFDPAQINIAISKPAEKIVQEAYLVHDYQKLNLVQSILKGKNLNHVLIFSSRKVGVKDISNALRKMGLKVGSIHSDLEQGQREEVLLDFRNKRIPILVATDILSRGIDISGIELVINYDIPRDAEDYVHRVGRTARAERTGKAITFINSEEIWYFQKIEKLIERSVPKIPLPEGFDAGPEYKIIEKRKGNKNFKNKRSPNHKSGNNNKPNSPRRWNKKKGGS